jgi:peptidoglycan L-alanyl-D-glutamate endopeptidase CwlK
MASRKIEDCVKPLQAAWEEALFRWDAIYPDLPKPFLTATYRSNEEQNKLYTQGRTDKTLPKVTNARGGQSPHNLLPSKAFDIAFKNKDKSLSWDKSLFKKFADIIKPLGVEWGGDFRSLPDSPHFQVPLK